MRPDRIALLGRSIGGGVVFVALLDPRPAAVFPPAMQQAGRSVEYAAHPGQPHVSTSQWTASIERTAAFLQRYLA